MQQEDLTALFSDPDGGFHFARWHRPIVPIVFGVEAQTISVLKGAIEAVVLLAGHKMAETDPEQGANLMIFFCRDWRELLEVPDLDRLVEGLEALVPQLVASGAHRYRAFRFESNGAIRACFLFLRIDGELADMPADTLALGEAAQMMLLWGGGAFRTASPLALANGSTVLRPEIGAIIRAAYDPVLPDATRDPSLALRLLARMEQSL